MKDHIGGHGQRNARQPDDAGAGNALREAELIIGARRLLENLPDGCTANRAAAL